MIDVNQKNSSLPSSSSPLAQDGKKQSVTGSFLWDCLSSGTVLVLDHCGNRKRHWIVQVSLIMAFKPERPTPFNAMAHLDPDTARFALAMRESKKDEEEDWMAGLSEEERAIIEEENKKKKAASRMKPCKVKDCVKTEQEVGQQILERASLMKKIDVTEEKVKDCADDITSLMALGEGTEKELDKLTTTLAALKMKEKKDLKEKLVNGRKVTTQLENQITKLQAWIRSMEDAEDEAAENEKDDSREAQPSSLPNIDFTLTKHHTKCCKKHTGVFRTSASGFPQWSCCRAEEEDEPGCQDDQSVGVKSTLVHRHSGNFKPYTIRQAEHAADYQNKMESLHHASIAPASMNKGFRDVRHSMSASQFYTTMGDSQVSHHSAVSGSKKSRTGDDNRSQRSGGEQSQRSGSKLNLVPDLNSPVNLGKASISYLESSMMKKSHEQMRFTQQRPSTSGANGRMGSMRLVQDKINSGPFPALKTVDVGADAYFQGRMVGKSMPRSDLSNERLAHEYQMLDSASLLASYNKTRPNKNVGMRRHLGLKDMRRLHGRPTTATSGPHLRQASTTGAAASLEHYCARMV